MIFLASFIIMLLAGTIINRPYGKLGDKGVLIGLTMFLIAFCLIAIGAVLI